MSLEQSRNEDSYEKKRKKLEESSTQDFFETQKLKAETANLLQTLAKDISMKYWIDISKVKNLIENKTSSSLEDLQSSLWNNETINLDDLLSEINSAKLQIEDLSKKYREELKKSIHQKVFTPENHEFYTSGKLFTDNFLQRIQDPQNFWDHILWSGVGIIDSSEAIIFFLYNLGKWILLTPYHLYLIVKWEATFKV